MKKILLTLVAALMFISAAYSYNPPAGGEDLSLLASPSNLSLANSVTGGALFNAGADSILVNPALTAGSSVLIFRLLIHSFILQNKKMKLRLVLLSRQEFLFLSSSTFSAVM